MNNLVTQWKELSKKKYGTYAEAVRFLNVRSGYKIDLNNLREMEIGKRNVPAVVYFLMLNDTMLSTFEEFNIDTSHLNLAQNYELISKLCPPTRS